MCTHTRSQNVYKLSGSELACFVLFCKIQNLFTVFRMGFASLQELCMGVTCNLLANIGKCLARQSLSLTSLTSKILTSLASELQPTHIQRPSNLPLPPIQTPGNLPVSLIQTPGKLPVTPIQGPGNLPVPPIQTPGNLPVPPNQTPGNLPVTPVQSPERLPVTPIQSPDSLPVTPVQSSR